MPQKRPSSEEIIKEMRNNALFVTPIDIGLRDFPSDSSFGLLMEATLPKASYTLVCFFDGTTSLYLSNGGGSIGFGQHDNVNIKARLLVKESNAFIRQLDKTGNYDYPVVGKVKFFIRTPSGNHISPDIDETSLRKKNDPLFPLYFKAQEVITEIRVTEEKLKQQNK